MKLYLILIAAAVFLISTVVTIVAWENFFLVLAVTALAAVLAIAVSGATAGICRMLPAKWIRTESKVYLVSAKEKKFYEKLKIRKWKDKIPEIGHLTGFRKNKIVDPKSLEYLDRFLLEICYGELGHFASLFTSFLLLLLFPIWYLWLPISIAVAIVSVLLNIPSLLTLRYNSYKLRILRENLLKKERRAQGEQK